MTISSKYDIMTTLDLGTIIGSTGQALVKHIRSIHTGDIVMLTETYIYYILLVTEF